MRPLSSAPRARVFRSSKRLTITLPQAVLEALVARSDLEGRSLSNLAAYLLESELEQQRGRTGAQPLETTVSACIAQMAA
jgi:hypothetical protein